MAEDNSSSFSLVSLGKPIEKLIDTVSKAVGAVYKPRAIRNVADAEAYKIEAVANAKAKASIIKSEAEAEIAVRARQRLYQQEMQRQINIDNVVDLAATYLKETVSEQPVDEDWRTRFFNQAQDVNSTDLQLIWAQILANEINTPGNFSLRTLNILCNLSKEEALVFSKFCTLVNNQGEVIKIGNGDLSKYDIAFAEIMLLKEIGLLNYSDDLAVKYKAMQINTDVERMAINIGFQYRGLIISNKNQKEFRFKIYSLTTCGQELARVIWSKLSDVYFEDLHAMCVRLGYFVQETRPVYQVIGKIS